MNHGMHQDFGSADAVCFSKERSSEPQNQLVQIVLKASNSVGAKDDVPKICRFVHPLHPYDDRTGHTRQTATADISNSLN